MVLKLHPRLKETPVLTLANFIGPVKTGWVSLPRRPLAGPGRPRGARLVFPSLGTCERGCGRMLSLQVCWPLPCPILPLSPPGESEPCFRHILMDCVSQPPPAPSPGTCTIFKDHNEVFVLKKDLLSKQPAPVRWVLHPPRRILMPPGSTVPPGREAVPSSCRAVCQIQFCPQNS